MTSEGHRDLEAEPWVRKNKRNEGKCEKMRENTKKMAEREIVWKLSEEIF